MPKLVAESEQRRWCGSTAPLPRRHGTGVCRSRRSASSVRSTRLAPRKTDQTDATVTAPAWPACAEAGTTIRAVKILVLVLGCLADPYPRLIRTIERTWASRAVGDVEVRFYYGGDPRRFGRHVVLPVPDDLA